MEVILKSSLQVQPHEYMGDSTGRPLDYGMVYFGEPNKDPEFNPINVYFDEALTIPAAQPVRTKGGFLNTNGDMMEVYAAETVYSVKVLDNYGRKVFYLAEMRRAAANSEIVFSLDAVGAVIRPLTDRALDNVVVKDFGGEWGLSIDNTLALQKMIDAGYTDIILSDCTLSSIQLAANKVYRIALSGEVKHKANATTDLFKLAEGTRLYLDGFNNSIDGNFTNQNNPVSLFDVTNGKAAVFKNTNFKNIKKYGITNRNSIIELIEVDACNFEEAALHSGTLGGGTSFISIFGGKLNVFNKCTFKQVAEPLINQNRNPAGIFISGSGATKKVVVTHCDFDNLGHNVAGNLESPLDIYSYCENVVYENNTFKRSRFNAFRVTNAGVALVSNNTVIQDVPIINDGGTPYVDAACFTGGIVARGYPVNDKDNDIYTLSGNKFYVNNVNVSGAVFSNDSPTKKVKKVVLDGNEFTSTGTNTARALFLNRIKDTQSKNNDYVGFNNAITVQQTDTLGLSGENAKLTIDGGVISGTGAGVYARDGISNLTTIIKDVDFSKNTGALAYSIRNTKNVTIDNCQMPANNNGEVSTNGTFYYLNNKMTFNSPPVGVVTNTFYRILNNRGTPDVVSA